jgi:putative ABC transport system permease protein
MRSAPTRPTFGDTLYRLLLRAYPRATREAQASEMADQFADERRGLTGRPVRLAALWCRASADVLWHGLLERLSVRPTVTSAPRRQFMDPTSVDRPGPGSRLRRFVLEGLTRDVRLATRRLAGSPAFLVVAVVTLALGIGANTAIFSVVNGVLLKPLPFPQSDRLVVLYQVDRNEGRNIAAFSPPNFLDVEQQTKTLASAAAFDTGRYVLTGAGDPTSLAGAEVTSHFFQTIDARPIYGRTFTPEENLPANASSVVLGYGLFQRRFGGDPGIVGRTITIDAVPRRVVGVMGPGFAFPFEAELWMPVPYNEAFGPANRGAWYLTAFGRLAPGATLDQASSELATIASALEAAYPAHNAKVGMAAGPLLDEVVGDSRRALLLMLSAVGLVLLIACANVANLLLARASARQDEMAVRVALGAGRAVLVRQLLVESLLVACAGGAAGLGLAAIGTRVLVAMRPANIPRLGDIGLDATVVAFTFGATLVTGILFGLVPALQVSRRPLSDAMRERGRTGTGGRRGQRTRSGLVIAEMALAVILLSGAALLVRSFARLNHVDPGFTVGEAVTFNLNVPDVKYSDDAQRMAFYDRLLERLRAVPGVDDAGAVLSVPPGPQILDLSFSVEGRPAANPGEEPTLEVRVADARYFKVMKIGLVRGRLFTADDREGTTPVALLTESAARKYFAAEDPIGKKITLGWRRHAVRVSGEVVGVVRDVKSLGLDQAAPPQIYVALAQVPTSSMAFVVRTSVPAAGMISTVTRAVAEIDPNLPVDRPGTLAERVSGSIAEQRFYMLLLALFAGVALALAAVGIFGVLSYLVTQRTREIGVRIALGARPGEVVNLILRRALLLAGTGVVGGLAVAFALAGAMRSMLFDLSPTDPVSFGLAAVGLLAVAAFAAWVPARRATSVDPLVALRAE